MSNIINQKNIKCVTAMSPYMDFCAFGLLKGAEVWGFITPNPPQLMDRKPFAFHSRLKDSTPFAFHPRLMERSTILMAGNSSGTFTNPEFMQTSPSSFESKKKTTLKT